MGSKSVRFVIAVLFAVPMAIGLFSIMYKLIDRDFENPDVETTKVAEIVRQEEEIETQREAQKPDKVDDPEEPPPEMDTPELDMEVDIQAVNTAPGTEVDVKVDSTGMSSGDGEYLPIVKVAPIYPRRAQTRGISGYCIVEYTVTTSGAIRDPKPVDCQPSGVFEKASVSAAAKFKYKPRVVDGEPIEVAGVQNKFTYELEE